MTEAAVKTRISKARAAFRILINVWKSTVIDKTTKIRLFNTNIKSVLLFGAATWRINNTTSIPLLDSACGLFWEYSGWTKLATRPSG